MFNNILDYTSWAWPSDRMEYDGLIHITITCVKLHIFIHPIFYNYKKYKNVSSFNIIHLILTVGILSLLQVKKTSNYYRLKSVLFPLQSTFFSLSIFFCKGLRWDTMYINVLYHPKHSAFSQFRVTPEDGLISGNI